MFKTNSQTKVADDDDVGDVRTSHTPYIGEMSQLALRSHTLLSFRVAEAVRASVRFLSDFLDSYPAPERERELELELEPGLEPEPELEQETETETETEASAPSVTTKVWQRSAPAPWHTPHASIYSCPFTFPLQSSASPFQTPLNPEATRTRHRLETNGVSPLTPSVDVGGSSSPPTTTTHTLPQRLSCSGITKTDVSKHMSEHMNNWGSESTGTIREVVQY